MDALSRRMIASGDLARRAADEGLRGITSNPTIFEKAVTRGADYAALAGLSSDRIYEELLTTDVRDARDILLRPVYDAS